MSIFGGIIKTVSAKHTANLRSKIDTLEAENNQLRLMLYQVSKAISDEPEYPGNPPQELMTTLMNGDRDLIIQALRLTVKLTKQGILARIDDILNAGK